MFSGNNNDLNLEFSDDYNDYNSFNEIEENLINYNIEIDNNEIENENEIYFDLLNNINNEENENKNKKIEIKKENKCCICGKEKELKELKETNQKCCDNCKNIIYDYEMNIIKKKKCIKCKKYDLLL